ncbi:MAG: TMEM165/GDT1 family protein [Thermodesulfobacteriota bacterium]
MDWKVFWITFGAVFLAEMGDKTQLAALTMTADTGVPVSVFTGASAALILATFLGVACGSVLTQWIPPNLLKKLAGVAFILIGGLMLLGKY